MPEASENSTRSVSIAAGTPISALLTRPPVDPLEARILVSHALQLSRIQLITQSERTLDADEAQCVATLFNRRIAGEPIAYLVGEREFFGLLLHTTPDVLIPRPETELLVELALERLPQHGRVLDMGTGSGAIAIAIAHARRDVSVTALDVSDAALAVAKKNALRHGVDITFLHGDWYRPLANEQFDLIVANPPYIVAGDPHLSQGDLRFEPIGALTDHGDGLSALRAIINDTGAHLIKSGWLLLEHGYDQSAAVRKLLADHGFHEAQSWTDLAGIERISGAMR